MSSTRSRVAVIYNPTKVGVDDVLRLTGDRATRHGWTDPQFFETTEEDPGTGQAAEAVAQGFGLVLACGGDGTVRSVAQGLIGSSVPMGIVPLGTGNLLARNLGIPLDDVDRALHVAMSGRSRPIDVGEVEFTDGDGEKREDVFLVMLGAGMDADMIAGTDDGLKARVGWLAYVGAFANTLVRGHRIKVEYALDDGPLIQNKARTLLVANCGMLQGGMRLLPDAEIDDGRLDVMELRAKGIIAWAQAGAVLAQHSVAPRIPLINRLAPRADEHGRTRPRPVDFLQGTQLRTRILEKPAAFQIDGEDCGTVTEFTARIKHRALTVRVAH